ncbi:MAG: hypothetical protein ACYC9S_09595 [Leptospirales bacterium]
MHRLDREELQKEELPGLCVLERERSPRKIVLVEIRPEYCLKQDKSFLEKSTGPFPETLEECLTRSEPAETLKSPANRMGKE